MSADPRAALSQLVAAFERHLEASSTRHGDDDPTVVAAYEDLADAFEAYDAALYDAYGEMTPLDIYSGDDDEDDDDDDEDDGTTTTTGRRGRRARRPRRRGRRRPPLYAGLDDDVEFDDDTDESDDARRR